VDVGKSIGKGWNEPLEKAWVKCYTTLAATMIAVTEDEMKAQ